MPGLKTSSKYLYVILFTCGFVFLKSSYGKFSGGTFVSGLAATLTKSVTANPYPWFKDFLNSAAIPNAYIFGTLTMWGELLTGLSLLICVPYLFFNKQPGRLWFLALAAGSFVGMFLNGIFWLAMGYTSSSTESLNLLMFVMEAAGFTFALNGYTTTRSKN